MARRMSKNRPVAKRANRFNPREDRNSDNVIDFTTRNKRGHQQQQSQQESFSPKAKRIELVPRNLAQEDYLEALQDESKTVVIGMGPSGTGKSYMALQYAVSQLQEGNYKKIVLLRPVVSADGSNLGALPGDILSKLAPYLGELLSLLKEVYGVKGLTKLLEEEVIEVLPIALIRGRSFRNTLIILEESQNIDEICLKLVLTRIGEGTRCLINGDIRQADRGFVHDNGLKNFVRRLEQAGGSSHFEVCNFHRCDIERHEVVNETLRIYGEED